MLKQLWVCVIVAGCSSSSKPNLQADAGAGVDAPSAPADAPSAPADAPSAPVDAPLPGAACPSQPVEVARIRGAFLQPVDNAPFFAFTFKQGTYTRDADGDGKADLLVVEPGPPSPTTTKYQIRLFRQTGNGFAPPVTSIVAVPDSAMFNAIGDFNGDHLLDVMFSLSTSLPREPIMFVALQQPDHTFVLQPQRNVNACQFSDDERQMGWVIADFNGDGKDDLLSTISYQGLGAAPESATLALGGDTGLGVARCITSAGTPTTGIPPQLAVASRFFSDDFDGDGTRDLVADVFGHLQLFHGTGPMTFQLVAGGAADPSWRVLFLDHRAGRSRQGLINADIGETTSVLTRFSVAATTGVSVAPIATLPEGDLNGRGDVNGIVVGDFNGDGFSDVLESGNAMGSTGGFSIACDRGSRWELTSGTFGTPAIGLRAIDFDGDGRDEIVASDNNSGDVVIYQLR